MAMNSKFNKRDLLSMRLYKKRKENMNPYVKELYDLVEVISAEYKVEYVDLPKERKDVENDKRS